MKLEVLQNLTFQLYRGVKPFENVDIESSGLLSQHHPIIADKEETKTGDSAMSNFFVGRRGEEHEDVVYLVLNTSS